MRALVLGGAGQLGTELDRADWGGLNQALVLKKADLDLTKAGAVDALVASEPWVAVVNAAAYTAVDQAESNLAAAFAANRDGPANLARACSHTGCPLVHVSTDYVFDGSKLSPYVEDDPVNPVNVYGASKAEGEVAVRRIHSRHLILRTSWVYSAHGRNFVKSMLRLAGDRRELRIVNDQHGCPTSAADLAAAIAGLVSRLSTEKAVAWGTYHCAGGGEATWYEFAKAIMEDLACRPQSGLSMAQSRIVPSIEPISTAEFGAAALRPRNSRLDCTKIARSFGIELRPWREGLRDVLNELHAAG